MIKGAQVAIKRIVINNPDASTDAIVDALKKQGIVSTTATVSTIRSGTRQTLKLIKERMPKGLT